MWWFSVEISGVVLVDSTGVSGALEICLFDIAPSVEKTAPAMLSPLTSPLFDFGVFVLQSKHVENGFSLYFLERLKKTNKR